MTTFEKKVQEICREMYGNEYSQIVIDLVQSIEMELLDSDSEFITRYGVGAAVYDCEIVIDINKFDKEVEYLQRLSDALTAWRDDIEATNIALGLPRES